MDYLRRLVAISINGNSVDVGDYGNYGNYGNGIIPTHVRVCAYNNRSWVNICDDY